MCCVFRANIHSDSNIWHQTFGSQTNLEEDLWQTFHASSVPPQRDWLRGGASVSKWTCWCFLANFNSPVQRTEDKNATLEPQREEGAVVAPWEDLLIRFDSIRNDWKTENLSYRSSRLCNPKVPEYWFFNSVNIKRNIFINFLWLQEANVLTWVLPIVSFSAACSFGHILKVSYESLKFQRSRYDWRKLVRF